MTWPIILPLLSAGVLIAGFFLPLNAAVLVLCVVALLAAVICAVHHAEVIAHKVGEPYGTLVLALAVTVIEVALVLSMMLAGGANSATVPRDTIYSALMVICNGVVGVCLLVGGLHHREQFFRIEGMGSGMAALAVLATLVLVMPSLTVSASVGSYTASQLIFVAAGSLLLWLVFVFIQTVRHRDYFLPAVQAADESVHAPPPSGRDTALSFVLLLVSLVSVVGLAKLMSPTLERFVLDAQAPKAVVGVLIAIVVLLPETWAAIRAARADRLQTSMNLAIGSAMASIGLTVPVVVVAAVWLDLPLTLGLEAKDMALLALTFVVGAITLGSGRTNLMQGAIHLVVFAAFLFLTLVP
ncbi:ionic transporter y4hA [Hydrogenophaga aromaticivorans]|uniref:calcium:proton antiporter n=1 Tax=Hydrogenophaga TaxID=47420 RepID=UPI001B36C6A6|nr:MULTISPECIES: ionic transporter y4hA [Hydrogenophaga]MDO9165877.1 ionic transporter y4hA [Rhodoferax sp.]MBQ0919260.1 ionic transporter y4hA [Hydrogenophaga aromaticivorans]MDO9033327.1 ionic transporter y4hA [Hydrogenophaga sp.]MDP2024091.1 ionic transporter y4hA [Hydrogenophaga sp.]UCU93667.1 ionic transporter y4hA [Hydrogenophaga taeniospiralis]